MAAEQFLHGVDVINIDAGSRPISTVRSSVIGIVGTAPDADATAFPLNTPVLIAGSRREAAKLDMTGDGLGTLPAAVDSILDQAGAVIVVIRVDKESTESATLANVIGGVDGATGQYEGVQALLGAESILGVRPRILLAPGFTHQRVTGGITSVTGNPGSGYTDGTYDLATTGGGGTGGIVTVTVVSGAIATRTIKKAGSGYTSTPTFSLTALGGGTGGTVTATYGTTGNAVVAELLGVADRLRAVIIADGPNTTDAAAIAYAGDFGSKRVFVVDPSLIKTDTGGDSVSAYASAAAAGLIARSDNDRGFWWSPSNQEVYGITGTGRAIDFVMGDYSSRANLLNEAKVATIIRQNGFRLWGNRTLSSDAKWAFLCVVRTADIINDSLLAAHLWAVDRGITKTYVQDVREGVRAYLRYLTKIGAILGGDCWVDPELNTPDQIAAGHVTWDFDFTPVYPAEHLTFRSHLVNNYIKEIF